MIYPRDMRGHGQNPPKANWPNKAKIAVQIVVNYEEGGENCVLHGDQMSEAFLSEIVGAANWPNQRHANMESIYEYGARAGFWRLHRLFTKMNIPVTVYGVATALARSPEQVAAMQEANWEIASHGYKWIEYKDYARETELIDIQKAIDIHTAVTGEKPRGWYTGRSSVNTLDLVCELGICDYISDVYSDDLPYWRHHNGHDQLIVPYTLDANDMRFATPQGFNTGDHFFTYLKDSFDALYREGCEGNAKMMSIGLHCRLIGRPGRVEGLRKFLEYAAGHSDVWFAKRIDIAEHWANEHPVVEPDLAPSRMSRDAFAKAFGGVYEHSPWVARKAYDFGIGVANDTAQGLNFALRTQFRLACYDDQLAVLVAHPDLAGKLASANLLTAESTSEQASAGLDNLTQEEKDTFEKLNTAYVEKFGFPYIIAVKDYTKAQIMEQFNTRINNDKDTEFATACQMVERIAELRIHALVGPK